MNKELLKESRTHGKPMYPISTYAVQESDRPLFDCHWHEEMEFIMVTEGTAIIQMDTKEYEVHAGQAIFVNSGVLHEALPGNSFPCSIHAIVFHSDLLNSGTYDVLQEKFIEPLVKKQVILPNHIENSEEWEKKVLQHLTEIVRLNEFRPHTYELATKALLYLIFSHIFTHGQITAPAVNLSSQHYKIERIKQVLNYMHSHFHQTIQLGDLAAEVNMSEEHLCRFFKQMMKKSPIEYINYYRMQKAAKLLENTDKKVVEVAMDVGFSNLSYFISVFKKISGFTPSQYRKSTQLEKEPRFV